MLPILGAIIGPIVSAVGSVAKSWLETRKVKAEGRIAIATAKVQLKVDTMKMKSQMDLSAMDGMKYSWKDEYLVILLTLPVIGSFIPGLDVYIATGFDVLKNNTPDWYKWALTGMIAATFGLRTWAGFKK
jgi:hypothetical protein